MKKEKRRGRTAAAVERGVVVCSQSLSQFCCITSMEHYYMYTVLVNAERDDEGESSKLNRPFSTYEVFVMNLYIEIMQQSNFNCSDTV